jgi:hypothetical protein
MTNQSQRALRCGVLPASFMSIRLKLHFNNLTTSVCFAWPVFSGMFICDEPPAAKGKRMICPERALVDSLSN